MVITLSFIRGYALKVLGFIMVNFYNFRVKIVMCYIDSELVIKMDVWFSCILVTRIAPY